MYIDLCMPFETIRTFQECVLSLSGGRGSEARRRENRRADKEEGEGRHFLSYSTNYSMNKLVHDATTLEDSSFLKNFTNYVSRKCCADCYLGRIRILLSLIFLILNV
jgi:hypothetical protein